MARVYTMRDVLKALANKVSEPETEGLAGQHLDTDGNGGRLWSGTGQTVAAQQLRIGGEDYTVRTGASGAAGYLTIGANAIWLGTHQVLADLNGKGILKMWKGASLAYERDAASAVLFDHGWVDGISWSGNLLNRPQYTSQGRYKFDFVESNGFMYLYNSCSEAYSDVRHNGHVCTTNPVSIPANATKLKVTVSATKGYKQKAEYIKFGLLPNEYKDATDDSYGGQMSSLTGLTWTGEQTFELTLNQGIAGTDEYRVVINLISTVKDVDDANMNIYKVWFE